jgi:queuine/archaeosine tRNA-ribosyltransferase
VDGVIDFYEACGVDIGASVDHIILAYEPDYDQHFPDMDPVPANWRRRQEITLDLAADFLCRHRARRCRFIPLGVAQGWSPASYAHSVVQLQAMGYRRIGLGGMVPLKTQEILACLEAASAVRHAETQFHLFGVTRCEQAARFSHYGVTSFDSTSPLKQAFMDDRDNYYTPERTFIAVRVPQVEKHLKLKRRIQKGEIDQAEALRLERACLTGLRDYGRHEQQLEEVLANLRAYEKLHDGKKDRGGVYREVLAARPWESCPCTACRQAGIHVIIFRGAERNRRRAYHNLWLLYRGLKTALNDKGRT